MLTRIASLAARAEAHEFAEHRLDAADIGGDLGVGEKLARLVLAGGIADLGGAAADQHDRPVASLLQFAQHHDAEQIADMQARRRAVEADIAGDGCELASLSSAASSVTWWT